MAMQTSCSGLNVGWYLGIVVLPGFEHIDLWIVPIFDAGNEDRCSVLP